ncbi:hypothetical protein D3C84_507060 [compost metagenome]
MPHRQHAVARDEQQHQQSQCAMAEPHQPGLALAAFQALQFFPGQRHQGDWRTEQKAPEHGFVQPVQALFEQRTALPLLGIQVTAFRIATGDGQVFIAVMQQMAVAIQGVGIPDGKRCVAKGFVQQRPAGRMTVQQFVLHRQPHHHHGNQQQRAQPQAQ